MRDVAYVGMVTRFLVELDGGGELQVVRQNLEISSQQAQELRGRRVRVAWNEAQTFALGRSQAGPASAAHVGRSGTRQDEEEEERP